MILMQPAADRLRCNVFWCVDCGHSIRPGQSRGYKKNPTGPIYMICEPCWQARRKTKSILRGGAEA
jgi:hypothetical protein